jgi:large subunit ribosomal protein L11
MEGGKIATIRLTLLANRASPSPTLGQALGQYGLNIANFCKSFNEKTKDIKEHVYIPARVDVYSHTKYEITIKSPSSTYLLKRTANLLKGSSQAKRGRSWSILLKEIYHLAIYKHKSNPKSMCKTLIGSAKSIGLVLSLRGPEGQDKTRQSELG